MAIDYIIEYECEPKRQLTAEGILQRIKEKDRAETVIEWFRAAGDDRPLDEMGFEFSRSTPEDNGDKQLIVVQDLLDHAAALHTLEHHCRNCPANRGGSPFGCMGFVEYPISAQAETWLLDRLPVPDEPLVWLLLKQGIQRLGYDGTSVKTLRDLDILSDDAERTYFQLPAAPQRRLGELQVSGDQALEMIFGVGEQIIPNHAGILLLFFHAIGRDLEAEDIQEISSFNQDARDRFPFVMRVPSDGDDGIRDIVAFFCALYLAWKLNVPLYVDA